MTILVTGGAGYIGSHTVLELLNTGKEVVVIDNLSNSSKESLNRVEKLAGVACIFEQGDILDRSFLLSVFAKYEIDSVIHFAGLKSVSESVAKPVLYYQNNVQGTLTLLDAMKASKVFKLVFSSSATVYGDPKVLPIKENSPVGATTNPYGASKMMGETILQDLAKSDPRFAFAILRYFNPVGAHPSGLIGEDPNGIPNNLLPYISQVAIGKRPSLSVFGNDYNTPDGTGVRDYIHVIDLSIGHLKAIDLLSKNTGVHIFNLGTGKGYSVIEMVKAFENRSKQKIPFIISARRDGDIASCYCSPKKAFDKLGWEAKYNLSDMMEHSWNWQKNNPNGYK